MGSLASVVRERYGSREHPGLDAIVRAFRQAHGQAIVGACFGVAGPVVGGHVATPNLAWDVDASVMARDARSAAGGVDQ